MALNIRSQVDAAYRAGRLRFTSGSVSNELIRQIACREWPDLISLCLSNRQVDDEGLFLLSQVAFQSMTALYLDGSRFSNAGLTYLCEVNWTALTSLDLTKNHMNSVSCKLITRMRLPKLEQLFLSDCEITDEGLRHLSKGQWPEMLKLFLERNKLSEWAYVQLIKCRMPQLRLLFVDYASASFKHVLLADFPKLESVMGVLPSQVSLNEDEQEEMSELQQARWMWQDKFSLFQRAAMARRYADMIG